MNQYIKHNTFLSQLIIPGSWIFSLLVHIPLFLALKVKDNSCAWMFEEWMPKAYSSYWSAIVVVAMAIMAGLYSRIVHALWFKRDPENQLTFQQRVSIKNHFQYVNIFLLVNLGMLAARKIWSIFFFSSLWISKGKRCWKFSVSFNLLGLRLWVP